MLRLIFVGFIRRRPSPGTLGRVLIVFAVAVPGLAAAAPATVKVFEASARATPDPNGAVRETFPENTAISVSEDSTDGWRRVRLADGGVGFIRDDELRLNDGGAAPPSPASSAALRPAPAPVLYVKDLRQMAVIAGNDQRVLRRVDVLNERRSTALGLALGGAVAGGLLVTSGLTVLAYHDCPRSMMCTTRSNTAIVSAGAGLFVVTSLVALALWPGQRDMKEVVDQWNHRHVDSPIRVDPGAGN